MGIIGRRHYRREGPCGALLACGTATQVYSRIGAWGYWNAIKSVRLSVTDFGFNGSFVRLALPEFKTL
jgi:hypothetical protein